MDMVKDVAEYAKEMVAFGVPFEEFAEQWPNLANSEYGEKLKAEIDRIKQEYGINH